MNTPKPKSAHTVSNESLVAERTASFWIHEMREGRMKRQDILNKLTAMPPEIAEQHCQALNKFRRQQVPK